jgi:AcrR family transcriptional regulator
MAAARIDKKAKQEKILNAALSVFAKKGFNGALIDDIAKEANIAKGTMYQYFKSKDALFFESMQWFYLSILESMDGKIDHEHDRASRQLEKLFEYTMGVAEETKDLFPLMMEFWAASTTGTNQKYFKKFFKGIYHQYRKQIAQILQYGIDTGEFRRDINVDAISSALVGVIDGLFLQDWFDKKFDMQMTSREFIDVIIKGISKKKGRK